MPPGRAGGASGGRGTAGGGCAGLGTMPATCEGGVFPTGAGGAADCATPTLCRGCPHVGQWPQLGQGFKRAPRR